MNHPPGILNHLKAHFLPQIAKKDIVPFIVTRAIEELCEFSRLHCEIIAKQAASGGGMGDEDRWKLREFNAGYSLVEELTDSLTRNQLSRRFEGFADR